LSDSRYLCTEAIVDSCAQFVYNASAQDRGTLFRFRNMVGKIAHALTLLLRLGYIAATAAGAALAADVMWSRWYGHGLDRGGFAEPRAS
jgi:hypothetical protein